MTTVVVAQRMWQRRDTLANWTAANSILAQGELGVEEYTAPTACKMKIGDGVTPYNTLPYFGGTGSGNTILTTSGIPSNSTGNNGDYAIDPTTQIIYGPKASGVWPAGHALKGNTMLTTSGVPSVSVGVAGDYANDPTAQIMYGPKTTVWPTGVTYKGYGAQVTTGAVVLGAVGSTYTVNIPNGLAFPNGTVVTLSDGTNYLGGKVTSGGGTAVLSVVSNVQSTVSGTITTGAVLTFGAQGPVGATGSTQPGAVWESQIAINVALAKPIDRYCPVGFTITSVTVLTYGGTGGCTLDILKGTYASFPPASSICASAKPAISAGTKYQDATLTGWTTTVNAGDVLRFVLNTNSVFSRIIIILGIM